jgi:predicted Zn-dependent protease
MLRRLNRLIDRRPEVLPFAPLVAFLLFSSVIVFTACPTTPPNLSPAGATAFNKTRVVKALDLVRDTAILANAQTPPVLSTDDTRLVVQFHEATVKTLQATDQGWQAAVSTAVTEFSKTLTPAQQHVIAPYLVLLQTLIAGLS